MATEPQTNPTPVTASQLTQALEGFGSQLEKRLDCKIEEKFVNFEKRIVTRLEKKVDIAVETLAQQTALGFADMEERFEEVNHNITGLKGDIRRIDIRFARQQEIADEHNIVRRVTTLEQKVGLK